MEGTRTQLSEGTFHLSMTCHFPSMMVNSPGVQAQLALGEALQSQKEKAQLHHMRKLRSQFLTYHPAPMRHEMAQNAGFLRASGP